MTKKKPTNSKKTTAKKTPEQNEWVLRLVDAAEKVVKGYEQYLLDRVKYNELAKLMKDLRELLPDGCKDDIEKNGK